MRSSGSASLRTAADVVGPLQASSSFSSSLPPAQTSSASDLFDDIHISSIAAPKTLKTANDVCNKVDELEAALDEGKCFFLSFHIFPEQTSHCHVQQNACLCYSSKNSKKRLAFQKVEEKKLTGKESTRNANNRMTEYEKNC